MRYLWLFSAVTCFGWLFFSGASSVATRPSEPTVETWLVPPPRALPSFGLLTVLPAPVATPIFASPNSGECDDALLTVRMSFVPESQMQWRAINKFSFALTSPETLFPAVTYLRRHPECVGEPLAAAAKLDLCRDDLFSEVLANPKKFGSRLRWANPLDWKFGLRTAELYQCVESVVRLGTLVEARPWFHRHPSTLRQADELGAVMRARIAVSPPSTWTNLIPLAEQWATYAPEDPMALRFWLHLAYLQMIMAKDAGEKEQAQQEFARPAERWMSEGFSHKGLPTALKVALYRYLDSDDGLARYARADEREQPEERAYHYAWDLALGGQTEKAIELLALVNHTPFDGYDLLSLVARERLREGMPPEQAFFPHGVSIGFDGYLELGDDHFWVFSGSSLGPLNYEKAYRTRDFPEANPAQLNELRAHSTDWREQQRALKVALAQEGLPTN